MVTAIKISTREELIFITSMNDNKREVECAIVKEVTIHKTFFHSFKSYIATKDKINKMWSNASKATM